MALRHKISVYIGQKNESNNLNESNNFSAAHDKMLINSEKESNMKKNDNYLLRKRNMNKEVN